MRSGMLSGRGTLGDCHLGYVTAPLLRGWKSAFFPPRAPSTHERDSKPATSVSCHSPPPPFSRAAFSTTFVQDSWISWISRWLEKQAAQLLSRAMVSAAAADEESRSIELRCDVRHAAARALRG